MKDTVAPSEPEKQRPLARPEKHPPEERPLEAVLASVLETGVVRTGWPLPLGVQREGERANFAIFSRHATRLWLELYA